MFPNDAPSDYWAPLHTRSDRPKLTCFPTILRPIPGHPSIPGATGQNFIPSSLNLLPKRNCLSGNLLIQQDVFYVLPGI